MQISLVKQWTDTIQTSIDSFKKFTDGNLEATNKVTDNLLKMKDFAELGKALMNTSTDLRKIDESTLNRLIHIQLGMINLKASATAIKDLSTITTDSMNRLMKSQTDMLNAYMEHVSTYLETLKRSRSTTDITTAQMHMFTEIQQKMKDNAVETMLLLEGVRAAMNALTEKTLDNMTAESPEGKVDLSESLKSK
jgi:hypothetical protein